MTQGSRQRLERWWSFSWSFHPPPRSPTRAHWLDHVLDVTCAHGTWRNLLDDREPTHNRSILGSRSPPKRPRSPSGRLRAVVGPFVARLGRSGLPAALAARNLSTAPEQPAADWPALLQLLDRVQELVEQTQRRRVVLVGLIPSRPRVPVTEQVADDHPAMCSMFAISTSSCWARRRMFGDGWLPARVSSGMRMRSCRSPSSLRTSGDPSGLALKPSRSGDESTRNARTSARTSAARSRRCLASARSWLRPWNRPAMAWPPRAAAAVMAAVTAGTQSAATL
jgi:hypothetical protein